MDTYWQLRHIGLPLTRREVPRIMRLGKQRTTIGRGLINDFVLDSVTFEGFVSRQHAVIVKEECPDGCMYVIHDKSTNGVIVNGYRDGHLELLYAAGSLGRKSQQDSQRRFHALS